MANAVMSETTRTPGADVEPVTPRRVTPVKWWAALGVGFFVLQVAVWVSWVASPRFATTTFGRDEVPTPMQLGVYFFQITTCAAFVYVIWRWVIRPIRREGRFTLAGMLVVAFTLMWFGDPMVNYSQNWVGYNTALVNFGSWTTDTPGWVAPASNLFGEPVLWIPMTLGVVFAGLTFLGAWVMRRAKARWPHLGKLGLMSVCFAALAVFDLVLEIVWMRTGIFAYAGSIDSMTIFSGHYYQFPLYEAVLVGFVMTAFSSLVYFRNDKGETVAERGASDLRASSRQATVIRFFAILGVAHLIFFSFNIAIQWFSLRADTWPQDVLERPYLTDGMCGPDTDYSCSGPGVPIPREASLHLDPDGNLVVPDGVTVRDESRIDQGAR